MRRGGSKLKGFVAVPPSPGTMPDLPNRPITRFEEDANAQGQRKVADPGRDNNPSIHGGGSPRQDVAKPSSGIGRSSRWLGIGLRVGRAWEMAQASVSPRICSTSRANRPPRSTARQNSGSSSESEPGAPVLGLTDLRTPHLRGYPQAQPSATGVCRNGASTESAQESVRWE